MCFPTLELSADGKACIASNQFQVCELGRGLDQNNQCQVCEVTYCERCYASLATCSICTSPFVSNQDGSKCVCPRGQSSNGAGGCSYCRVDNCEQCASSQAYTCNKCFSPFVLGQTGLSCEEANQDLFDQISSIINEPFRKFSEEFSDSFGSGVAIGILSTVLLLGVIAVVYHFCTRKNKNNGLIE